MNAEFSLDSLLEHVYFSSNGIRLHGVMAGPKEGPLVILLHGYPEFWRAWKSQIIPLAEAGMRVLALDQRGYNLSEKPAGLQAYRLREAVNDVLGVLDALGVERVRLVGHDWGGAVSWKLALDHPQRVERLAMLNMPHPHVVYKKLTRNPMQMLRSSYVAFFQLARLPEAMLRNNDWELMVNGLIKTSRPGTFSPQDFEYYRRAWWQHGAMTAMLNWYRANFRFPAELPADPILKMPFLMLWGSRDVALMKSMAQESMAYCPQGELVTFESATHWLQHEEPNRVSSLLIRFFKHDRK